jgi:hypothetical protein
MRPELHHDAFWANWNATHGERVFTMMSDRVSDFQRVENEHSNIVFHGYKTRKPTECGWGFWHTGVFTVRGEMPELAGFIPSDPCMLCGDLQ